MDAAELIPHLLEHALEDTLYLVPFLFVTYLLLEALEHKAGGHAADLVRKAGAAGPAVGSLLGAVPQCGFSAAGAALYASRAITLGTLFAVLLSTSDEMLPLFIAEQVDPAVMAAIVGAKIVIGMVMGFAVDAVLRLRVRMRLRSEKAALTHPDGPGAGESAVLEAAERDCASEGEAATDDTCGCAHDHGHEHGHERCGSHEQELSHECGSHRYERGHVHHHSSDEPLLIHHNPACHCDAAHSTWKDVVLEAVRHTLEVSVIVFAISLVLVAVLELAGEEALTEFLAGNPGLAIFGSALVGLIPNCGASVVITQLYLDGMLGTGAMMSGLLVSGGVGLLVLFGENRRLKQNLLILATLYAIGVVWGILFEALGIVFL